jgi:carbon-monoxide dehydrogenase large subunit
MDYLLPVVTDAPVIEFDHIESPSPSTSLGTKGVGEAGTIGAYGAIANAVADALSPLGAEVRSLPLSPEKLYRALVEAGTDPLIVVGGRA